MRSLTSSLYTFKMVFSYGALCIFTLILGTPPPASSASVGSVSEVSKSSVYKDTSSDPNFPWTYARVKRQLYRNQIPQHRPLSGNNYAQHVGYPQPGRWHDFPGAILRANPNSGHHFDNPNLILNEADFQRYGSTLQHLDHGPPIPTSVESYAGGAGGGGDYSISNGGTTAHQGVIHHNGEDLPVKILVHHHYHPPIIADPIEHPSDPTDQKKLAEFNQNEIGVGHGQGHPGPVYGHAHAHGGAGGAIPVPVLVQPPIHAGQPQGGLILAPAPHQHHPEPIPVIQQEQVVEVPGPGVEGNLHGGDGITGHGLEEGNFAGLGHEIGYGHGHAHGHLQSPKHRPFSSLFNIHDLVFGPARRPVHHTPAFRNFWPSAYGKWRHRPFSWSFSS